MKCDTCNGKGSYIVRWKLSDDKPEGVNIEEVCHVCDGTGQVGDVTEDEVNFLRSRLMDMEADIRAALVLIEDILDDDISALARSDVLALKGHLEDLVPDSLVCSICGAPAQYIANNERRCNEHKRE